VNYLKVINGAIVQMYTTEIKKELDESPEGYLHILLLISAKKSFPMRELLRTLIRNYIGTGSYLRFR
jgi:excinuclease ABC subunit C